MGDLVKELTVISWLVDNWPSDQPLTWSDMSSLYLPGFFVVVQLASPTMPYLGFNPQGHPQYIFQLISGFVSKPIQNMLVWKIS